MKGICCLKIIGFLIVPFLLSYSAHCENDKIIKIQDGMKKVSLNNGFTWRNFKTSKKLLKKEDGKTYISTDLGVNWSLLKTAQQTATIKDEIILFPQPAKTFLTLSSEYLNTETSKIIIMNVIGKIQIVDVDNINQHSLLIDVSGYSPGLYLLSIQNNKNEVLKQKSFIVE